MYHTNRREALRNMAVLLGGAFSASTLGVLFDSCNTPPVKSGPLFTADQQELVTAIANIIIPDTDTPGAKAAGTGPFISMMVEECAPKDVQQLFLKGLADTDLQAKKAFNASFARLNAQQQHTVLKQMADDTIALKKTDSEKQAGAAPAFGSGKGKPAPTVYFFSFIRELTLLGYFTSKIGTTQALVYVPVPGRYDGNLPYHPGQKAWAL